MKLSRVGVDLAKNVYQLHGVDRHGKTTWKRRLRRGQWLQALLDNTDPGCEIGMEACTECARQALGSTTECFRLLADFPPAIAGLCIHADCRVPIGLD